MATAIVYLDIDDEITSAVARLRSLKEERIALTLPHGSRLATSRINFRLLAREAAKRKKTLEIVTGDASARALAASAGLPTYVSVAAFEAGPVLAGAIEETRTTRPRPGSEPMGHALDDSPTIALTTQTSLSGPRAGALIPHVGRRGVSPLRDRRLALILGLVAILAAGATAGFQLLPSATIVLIPAQQILGPVSLNVTAQEGITSPDPANLLIPATAFAFDVAVTDTFPATGLKIDETKSAGRVTFENCDTGGSVEIRAGARVATRGGIEFLTDSRIAIKKAHIFPFACQVGSVPIHAALPGDAGNVASGAITIVPSGYDKDILRVTNEAATTGGTHVETTTVQQSDVDAALRNLDVALATKFDDQLAGAANVPPGTTLFAETKQLDPSTPTVDPTSLVGLSQPSFDLGLTAKGTALGVDPSPVPALVEARIPNLVHSGFALDQGSIGPLVGVPVVAGRTITFPVTVRATETRIIDGAALRDRIRGLALPQARTVLGAYGQVTISVWPNWVTTIPANDSRVSFEIDEPTGSNAAPSTPGGSPGASGAPSPSGVAP